MGGVRGGGGGVRGGGGGGVEASCAYLASIESLDDASDDDDDDGRAPSGSGRPPPSAGGSHGIGGGAAHQHTGGGGSGGGSHSHGSGDSGRCSPGGGGGGREAALPFAQRVVAEVLDSERLYVRDLRQVVLGYLHCWRSQTDCAVSDQQLADLFSNIEEIYKFNSGFLERLEACGLDPVAVARCFVEHTAGFCIYTHYCTHYPRTVGVLTELMRRESSARAFRDRQTALAHALPLGSFLLKPVQRILKYHLLLHNMLKHLEVEGEDGRADVARALSSMTDIAQRINSMKRRHEHAVRVQEIQSLLYGWEGEDLTTFGELCAEGAFRMAGAKALRHAFLFDRMLLITKQKAEGVLGYKAHILCSNLMLIESVPGEPLSFHVIPFDNPRLQYTLRARNLEQKREWALQLKRVILENYNAVIPSHARRLVMELGQHRTDDEILADKTPPRRQHSAPEYLEKRKQERERRKSEVGLRQRLRRARKSDAGLSPSDASSPTSQRRHRRASSSSRERSHSRDGLRSVSPAAIKERFGSWRRKSEPGVYSSKSDSLTLLPERPVASSNHLQVDDRHDTTSLDASELDEAPPPSTPPPSPAPTQRGVPSSAAGGSTGGAADAEPSVSDDGHQQQQRSLEEIVGALLLQNRDFQKALRRQHRRQQTRVHLQLRNGGGVGAHAETSDTEAEGDGDDGAYESLTLPHVLTPPSSTFRRTATSATATGTGVTPPALTVNGLAHKGCASADEEDADYVTLSSVPSRRRSGQYDNLQQIWESVRAQQEEIRRLAEREGVGGGGGGGGGGNIYDDEEEEEDVGTGANRMQLSDNLTHLPSLRRAQSFCASSTPPPAPPQSSSHPSATVAAPPCASSLEALDGGAPTTPAVWLRQQGAHLATPSKKSGSLPRSFPLAPPYCFSATAAAILAGTGPRPFTIASDPPSEINFEDIERYMAQAAASGLGGGAGGSSSRGGDRGAARGFPLAAGDTTEDESLPEASPTPTASLQDINVHPQHKIYRPTSARASLRQVVVSVGARLTSGLRSGSAEALDDTSSEGGGGGGGGGSGPDARRTTQRFVAALRHYGGKTRLRLRSFGGDHHHHHTTTAAATAATTAETEAAARVASGDRRTQSPSTHRSPPPPVAPPPPPSSSLQTSPAATTTASSIPPHQPVPLTNGSSTVPEPLPIYKQGSSRLGARIALCSSDYADPRRVLTRLPPLQPLNQSEDAPNGRPDSVLSASSTFTSSSDEHRPLPVPASAPAPPRSSCSPPPPHSSSFPSSLHAEGDVGGHRDDPPLSDGSADSYYERSFEAIEALLLENEVFRDSAVFSDHDDPEPPQSALAAVAKPFAARKVPPPVPAKPDTLRCRFVHAADVKEKSRVLAETAAVKKNSLRSATNGMDGDGDTPPSASAHHRHQRRHHHHQPPPCCDSEDADSNAMQQKGWVKHVIGKLQGPADTPHGRRHAVANKMAAAQGDDLG